MREIIKRRLNVAPVPVKSNMPILLRPYISWRKKYSDRMRRIIAIRKGQIYFLLITKNAE
jgi:hypothetical protein